jgi:diacylglycerol kinase family enzyme
MRRGIKTPKVAILLNKNARKVNARTIKRLRAEAPHAELFVTESMEEAERALSQVAQGRYDVLFTGGGDGTVCHAITRVSELCEGQPAPHIGVLPLGTGNAIASYLHAPSITECLTNAPRAERQAFAFPSARGSWGERKAAFGGFGWDAVVLDHYFRWRAACKDHPFMSWLAEGLPAYLISGLGWAVPSMLIKPPRWDIKVINKGEEAYRITPEGQLGEPIAPGEVIYEGPAQLCTFGSCPYFGFKLKALPFAASHPHLMQLRIADISPIKPVLQLHKMWRGTYRHERLWDFLASDFSIELSHNAAMQLGGDIVGHERHMDVSLGAPSSLLRYGRYHSPELKLPHLPRKGDAA